MTFILKTTESYESSPVGADNPHCLYADIVSIGFRREEGGVATAVCQVREPIKTAEVPGYVEITKNICFSGYAYVMNESGKTVSTFSARTSGDPLGPNRHLMQTGASANGMVRQEEIARQLA